MQLTVEIPAAEVHPQPGGASLHKLLEAGDPVAGIASQGIAFESRVGQPQDFYSNCAKLSSCPLGSVRWKYRSPQAPFCGGVGVHPAASTV